MTKTEARDRFYDIFENTDGDFDSAVATFLDELEEEGVFDPEDDRTPDMDNLDEEEDEDGDPYEDYDDWPYED